MKRVAHKIYNLVDYSTLNFKDNFTSTFGSNNKLKRQDEATSTLISFLKYHYGKIYLLMTEVGVEDDLKAFKRLHY